MVCTSVHGGCGNHIGAEKDSRRLFWYTLITLIFAMAIPYSIINQIMGTVDRSVLDPITPIDSMVPFIGWTFVIYVSLYLYYPELHGLVEIMTKKFEKCSPLSGPVYYDLGSVRCFHHISNRNLSS